MMRPRSAAWIVALMGTVLLAASASVSCGDGDETGPAGTKVGPLEITEAYAHAVMDGGAVYLTVKNTGQTDDALIGASTEVAGNVTLHRTVTEGATTRMEPVDRIEIPAKGETTLQPGGYHLMLMELKEELEAGDTIGVELIFESAGSVTMRVPVTPYGE